MLRYFNVFGPRQSPFSQYAAMVPLFITAIDAGEPVTVYGDGEQSRDFTYVANVVDATVRAAHAEGASGRIFNVAAGSPASVNAVADAIGRILDKPVERSFAPPRPGDIRDSWADVSAANEVLGYAPSVELEDGLRRTIELPAWLSRVKVLRVIARLNVGGPALHVAYLTAGLAERGYDTTLVAGTIARGEESMAFVADAHNVAHRDVERAASRDLAAARPARDPAPRAADPARAADDPAHAHGEGRRGRADRRAARAAARGRRSSCTRSTGTCCADTSARVTTFGFRTLERWLARMTTALVAVSPEVRDDLVALGVAPGQKFAVVRLGIELDERVDNDGAQRRETRRQMGLAARTRSSSAGSAG